MNLILFYLQSILGIIKNKEIRFCIDDSGSMAGFKINFLKPLVYLAYFLNKNVFILQHENCFRALSFNKPLTGVKWFFKNYRATGGGTHYTQITKGVNHNDFVILFSDFYEDLNQLKYIAQYKNAVFVSPLKNENGPIGSMTNNEILYCHKVLNINYIYN
mgnify:CR=1 FL=1